ncbi:hypothetical protein [Vibrio gallaecicus]|uniref:hypothetical protein n=1 Tax=Vibrio gallaecicus TaxID=552386 RepID=UPI0025B32C90|nr:hypothetical protein [Vibrio gallaecicus]MDN3613346.1 hypothetical protein [Vibrio gallaecicus]
MSFCILISFSAIQCRDWVSGKALCVAPLRVFLLLPQSLRFKVICGIFDTISNPYFANLAKPLVHICPKPYGMNSYTWYFLARKYPIIGFAKKPTLSVE